MAPFGPFEASPMLAVAVSGGRDSLALVLLARDWAARRNGSVLALIVDHGLRPEAAAEAAATRDLLAGQSIESEILKWTGTKPSSGLQEAAREARYRLLFEACRRHGILHLLVAHHADDQAETIAMRAAHASGQDGLAGMAALVEHRDARLLRPLLAVSRARLTALLVERNLSWIDDPSNADCRFERVRLRVAGVAPFPVEADLAVGRPAREGLLAANAVAMLDLGQADEIAFDHTDFAGLDEETGRRLLGRVVQALGQRDYPPRRARVARAVARISGAGTRGKSGKGQDFTLAECHLKLRQGHDRRLRWIVRAENVRKEVRNDGQPIVPAVFFACGAQVAPHLE